MKRAFRPFPCTPISPESVQWFNRGQGLLMWNHQVSVKIPVSSVDPFTLVCLQGGFALQKDAHQTSFFLRATVRVGLIVPSLPRLFSLFDMSEIIDLYQLEPPYCSCASLKAFF